MSVGSRVVCALAIVLAVACSASPEPDDVDIDVGAATTATDSSVAGEESRETATEPTGRPDVTDSVDPFEEIEWALTPAGPGSPSVNEDSIYKVLDDLDPLACAALLEPDEGWFDPSTFGTGERSVHLFRAAAQLCAGDRDGAIVSYQQARQLAWDFAVEQPLHSRVCNVWDAVTRMLDPGAGACALEELAVDGPTDDEDAADPAAPSEPPTESDTTGSDTAEPGTDQSPAGGEAETQGSDGTEGTGGAGEAGTDDDGDLP